MNTALKPDVTQHPMPLARQKQVYEACTIVNYVLETEHTRGDGATRERHIVNALLNAGWRPPKPLSEDEQLEKYGRLID